MACTNHLKGHSSLLEMISPHIEHWRAALVDSLMLKGDPDERELLEDEIRSLDEIASALDADRCAGVNDQADLQAENEQLRALLAERVVSETGLQSFVASTGGFNIGLEGGAFGLLAHAFAKQLYESNAENYIELHFQSLEYAALGQIVLTLKRETGKTPHALRLEAEEHCKILMAEKGLLLDVLAPFVRVGSVIGSTLEGLVSSALLSYEVEIGSAALTGRDLLRACQIVESLQG